MRTGKTQKGMTLIEVLVAIVIMAVAVSTLLSLLSIQTRNAIAIRDRAMARIAAENAMIDVVAADMRGVRLEEGGVIEIGDHRFSWSIERTPTPYPGLDSIMVLVRPSDGVTILASLSTVRPQ